MQRRVSIALLSVPLAGAGWLTAHSVADKLAEPHSHDRSELLSATGHGYLELAFNQRFDGTRYRPDSHWEFVIPPWFDVQQDEGNSTQFDERNGLYYEAYGMSYGSVSKTVGIGQAYLGAYRDKFGHAFDGGQSYRLRVPPNAPAKLFWSVSLYDLETRCLVQNETEVPDRVSLQDLDENADGSVDLYLGPASPEGHEKNWIQTAPGRAWYAYLRFYSPTEAYFDNSWKLPDIELIR